MKMEENFKVLMYLGNYVDEVRLLSGGGLYLTSTPSLHDKDTVIQDITGIWGYTEKVAKDLRQCQLVDVQLKIN